MTASDAEVSFVISLHVRSLACYYSRCSQRARWVRGRLVTLDSMQALWEMRGLVEAYQNVGYKCVSDTWENVLICGLG